MTQNEIMRCVCLIRAAKLKFVIAMGGRDGNFAASEKTTAS